MSAVTETPLIFFSGMAADASILAPQMAAFPNLLVPEWPQPIEDESLSEYCERLAEKLRPHGAVAIGGVSFGGIVALEVAQFLKPPCVILIASVRGPSEMPWRIRALGPFLPLLTFMPIRWMQWLAGAAPLWSSVFAGVVKQFRQADPVTLRWSIRQIFHWKQAATLACPLFQIHGDRDFVFPVSKTKPQVIVQGGGHLISVTRGRQVNEFVQSCLEQVLNDASPPSLPAGTPTSKS
jgi:pimeloyl-ACP methyl ester carboxylesterase